MATTHHVTLRKRSGLAFTASFDDVAARPEMVFDEPPPVGEGGAPSAAAVLAAAVGNCLGASFAFCADRARVALEALEVRVAAHVDRNEQGRLRIVGIDVALEPTLAVDGDPRGLARCAGLFEEFCTVTASVRQGVPVSVTVAAAQPAEAA